MNILPKKRWHVRTKDNIARVRKDEAEAAEKQRKTQLQINRAEQEARINYLRHTSDVQKESSTLVQDNVHSDFLNITQSSSFPNKEFEKEKKLEKEKYEKQIGYLTYVGQHRNQPNLKRWYEIAPDRNKIITGEEKYTNKVKDLAKSKSESNLIKTKIPKEVFKSICKNQKSNKNELMDLRKKRLIREANERKRERAILNK